MAVFLVQVATGPSDPNRATLACLIALTALREGHQVSVFLVGDGVHLFAPEVLAVLEGQGTGRLADHVAGIAAAGGRFFVSRKSAAARGYDAALLAGHPAEFGLPEDLVRLIAGADRVITY